MNPRRIVLHGFFVARANVPAELVTLGGEVGCRGGLSPKRVPMGFTGAVLVSGAPRATALGWTGRIFPALLAIALCWLFPTDPRAVAPHG